MGHSRSNIAAGMQIYICSVGLFSRFFRCVRAVVQMQRTAHSHLGQFATKRLFWSVEVDITCISRKHSIHSICVFNTHNACTCIVDSTIGYCANGSGGSCSQDAKRHFRPYLMCLHIIIINATAAGKLSSRPHEWCRS